MAVQLHARANRISKGLIVFDQQEFHHASLRVWFS
jgi:hypothetical protein